MAKAPIQTSFFPLFTRSCAEQVLFGTFKPLKATSKMQSSLREELILHSVMHLHSLYSAFFRSFTTLTVFHSSQVFHSSRVLIQRRKHSSSRYWSYSETCNSCFGKRSPDHQVIKKTGAETFLNTSTVHVRDYFGILQLKNK